MLAKKLKVFIITQNMNYSYYSIILQLNVSVVAVYYVINQNKAAYIILRLLGYILVYIYTLSDIGQKINFNLW